MTIKGLRDGAFLAGLALLWLDVADCRPAGAGVGLLVTVPVLMRVFEAARKKGSSA